MQKHLESHLTEFPGFTAGDYILRATELLNSSIGGNILGFTGKTGRVYRYDKSMNDYAVGSKGGRILTLFKPVEGMEFWNRKVNEFDKS